MYKRQLVHQPQTIILDEPTNGLDVMATRGLRDIVRQLRDAGHCVVVSSHVMQEVTALCDHIVIIDEGKVAMQGNVDSIMEQTRCEDLEEAFVAAISRAKEQAQ